MKNYKFILLLLTRMLSLSKTQIGTAADIATNAGLRVFYSGHGWRWKHGYY